MTPGYIIYFHTDDSDCFITQTLDPIKAITAYRNIIEREQHKPDVVVEIYRAKFEGTDKESLAEQTVAYYEGEFTSLNCTAMAIYVKNNGTVLSSGEPINLRPVS